MAADIPTQRRNLPLLATHSNISGGTYIITGANTGLGLEAARHLSNLNAEKVILAVRNTSAGEKAKADIDATTTRESSSNGSSNSNVEVWPLDLSSYASVKAFSERANAELERIDAVISNAGVVISERVEAEGHVLPVTVNVLSTVYLAVLLLPRLRGTAEEYGVLPRLVVVSSGVGFDVAGIWEAVKRDPLGGVDAEGMDLLATYPVSKLMDTLAVRELASKLPVERGEVIINAACPGLCITGLSRNAPSAFREELKKQHAQFGRTAEDGSRTLLFGAVAGKESHGAFLADCEIRNDKVPEWVADEEGQKWQKNLWEVIVQELEGVDPGCVQRALQ